MLQAFTAAHDQAISMWEEAMRSGDTSKLEDLMAQNYHVRFAQGGTDEAEYFTRDQAIEGMRSSVQALLGTSKHFEHRLIRMRGETEAVVFFSSR